MHTRALYRFQTAELCPHAAVVLSSSYCLHTGRKATQRATKNGRKSVAFPSGKVGHGDIGAQQARVPVWNAGIEG